MVTVTEGKARAGVAQRDLAHENEVLREANDFLGEQVAKVGVAFLVRRVNGIEQSANQANLRASQLADENTKLQRRLDDAGKLVASLQNKVAAIEQRLPKAEPPKVKQP